jgi:hypothetical protein
MFDFPNRTGRHDRLRVAAFRKVDEAVEALGLPLSRSRKLGAICNAIEIQIEDGGDHPEVNSLLLVALRRGLEHQVGEAQAAPVLRAIDTFEGYEHERLEKLRRGEPLPRAPLDILDDLTAAGTVLLEQGHTADGCARLESAWELVKQHCGPEIRTTLGFYTAHGPADFVINWFGEWLLGMECLRLERLSSAAMVRERQAVREFYACFPDEPADLWAWEDNQPEPPLLGMPPLGVPPAASGAARKPGRNDPCWCGSGRKYKVCHLRADRG